MNAENLNFYSFFTKYSLMEEYGFGSGLINRFFRKILPIVPSTNTVEYFLLTQQEAVHSLLSQLDLSTVSESNIGQQLDLGIKALCTKVIAFGLDSNIKAKYGVLELGSKPFEDLLEKVNHLSEDDKEETEALIASLEAIEVLIIDLRKNKHTIGTSFHLTLTTRRILDYTRRIKELLDLKLNISSEKHWEHLFTECIEYLKRKDSIRRYLRRHSDLIALEIVEHTSNKGEKYIAENRKEYWGFFTRALLGGAIISVFALIKLIIDSYHLSELNNAFFFSLNYALCFIIVKQVGGIIATKQPAMTASTIAKNIDKQDNLQLDSINSITSLVRQVFRSQFISIIGNF
jgi:site-specific recombinase